MSETQLKTVVNTIGRYNEYPNKPERDYLFNQIKTEEDLEKLQKVGHMAQDVQEAIYNALSDTVYPLSTGWATALQSSYQNGGWAGLASLFNNVNGFEVLPGIYRIDTGYLYGPNNNCNTAFACPFAWEKDVLGYRHTLSYSPPYDISGVKDFCTLLFGRSSIQTAEGDEDRVIEFNNLTCNSDGKYALADMHFTEKNEKFNHAMVPTYAGLNDITEGTDNNIHFNSIKFSRSEGKLSANYVISESYLDELYLNTLEKWKGYYGNLSYIKNFRSYTCNGSVTSDNKRKSSGIMKNTLDSNKDLSGYSTYMFFVKVHLTTKGKLTDYLIGFNIMSLLNQSGFGGSDGRQAGQGDIWTDRSFISVPIWDEITYITGFMGYETNYIPFPYYILYTGNYFRTNTVLCSGCESNRSEHYDRKNNNNIPWQNGETILSTKDNFIDFMRRGLGISATDNIVEATSIESKDWKEIEIPETPDDQQTGGGTGGSGYFDDKEKFEDIGKPSDNTGYSGLQGSWLLTESKVKELNLALIDPNVWESLKNIFKNNPSDGIISLNKFPLNLDKYIPSTGEENVVILGTDISNLHGGTLLKGIKMPSMLKSRYDCGSFTINPRFNNYLDFAPYTKYTLFIPFIGFRELSANDITNKKIKIVYDIDFSDGACKCIVLVSNEYLNSKVFNYTPMYVFDGNVAQQIPLNTSDKNDRTQNAIKDVLGATIGITAGAITGGAGSSLGAAMIGTSISNSVVQSGTDLLLNKPNYRAGGTTNNQFTYAINNAIPFLIVEYPDSNVPRNIEETNGFTCNFYDFLNQFRGFTLCSNVNNVNFGTEKEKEEIKKILESGVII